MMKCNKENMRALVDALYSGEYEQCQGTLRHGDDETSYKYCCLGVATHLAVKAGVQSEETFPGYLVWKQGTLPPETQQWLGIDSDNPLLDFGGGNKLVATFANDTAKLSFEQIAAAFKYTFLGSSDAPEHDDND